jgi:hypothetical protein
MASLMAESLGGPSNKVSALCDVISSYIMSNAVGTYASGQVTGAYPSPSGSMIGAGVGGTIS